MLPRFNFNFNRPPKPKAEPPPDSVPIGGPSILPPAPQPAPQPQNDPPPDSVPIGGTTHWMRPPENQPMEDGTMPGEEGYVDPHAGVMAEWENIDKGPTGGFRPDGTAIMHSDPDSAHSLGLLGESGASTGGGGYGKKRVAENSRGQANLTGKRRSSLLTGRV